jgi:ArsR family transcriptional regulator, arsenate/arsenite/antimonite-responsive transcriptional repressor
MATRTALDAGRALRLLQAIAEPTRFDILRRLRHGERCVCDLTGALDAAQSRLSFHLKVLKDAGLVSDRREGRWTYYILEPEALDEIQAVVEALRPDLAAKGLAGKCC